MKDENNLGPLQCCIQRKMGVHLIADAWGAPSQSLNDINVIRTALMEAIEAGGATLIDLCAHQFSPQGITATATLAESHIAIHTWPEHGYFAVDLFFCGRGKPREALEVINRHLEAQQMKIKSVERSFPEKNQALV